MKIAIKTGSPRTIYLYVMLLLSVQMFYIVPFSMFMDGIFPFMFLVAWMALGHFLFKPVKYWFSVTSDRRSLPAVIILLAVALSFIPAQKFFGQSILTSVTVSRGMLSLLVLPLLFAIKPTAEEIERAVTWFTITAFAVTVLDSAGIPILDREKIVPENSTLPYIEPGDFVHLLPGSCWAGVCCVFKLARLREAFSMQRLLQVLFFLSILFLYQNRTMLFTCVLIAGLSFLSIKGRSRINTLLFRALTIFMFAAVLAITMAGWQGLVKETTDQLGDSDYNRLKAVAYFFSDGNHGTMGTILGNGMISAKTSSIMKEQMENGIYNSDVGMIGLWNYYGLIPIITILVTLIIGMLRRKSTFLVKGQALFILGCSLTIACFDGMEKNIWLCVYLYLLGISELTKKQEKCPE